uniref:Uncharacterized protein n=1 Tax=Tetraselmis sp. GSL018 TaxID=582737 RepID=A0A061QYJ8_9CHLO|mmetsp:Transcript_21155/g.50508  ORF Transcript_21155/g.50508 Transcript_21155/m.50508 type:complete len:291 (-) Transcript_21155:251-1123(-)
MESPRIRIRFEFDEKPEKQIPYLRKSTRGFDVYEVDGFVFKRKRDWKDDTSPDTQTQAHQPAVAPVSKERREAPIEVASEHSKQIVQICEDICAEYSSFHCTNHAESEGFAIRSALQSWLHKVRKDSSLLEINSEGSEHLGQLSSDILSQRKSMLKTILEKLEQQEREWLQLQEQVSQAKHHRIDETTWREMDAAFTSDVETEAAKQRLAAAQREAHQQLSLQVEAYSGLVNGIEAMLERVEEACSVMQAHYHEQTFDSFEHFNSPTTLIKELSMKGDQDSECDRANRMA